MSDSKFLSVQARRFHFLNDYRSQRWHVISWLLSPTSQGAIVFLACAKARPCSSVEDGESMQAQ